MLHKQDIPVGLCKKRPSFIASDSLFFILTSTQFNPNPGFRIVTFPRPGKRSHLKNQSLQVFQGELFSPLYYLVKMEDSREEQCLGLQCRYRLEINKNSFSEIASSEKTTMSQFPWASIKSNTLRSLLQDLAAPYAQLRRDEMTALCEKIATDGLETTLESIKDQPAPERPAKRKAAPPSLSLSHNTRSQAPSKRKRIPSQRAVEATASAAKNAPASAKKTPATKAKTKPRPKSRGRRKSAPESKSEVVFDGVLVPRMRKKQKISEEGQDGEPNEDAAAEGEAGEDDPAGDDEHGEDEAVGEDGPAGEDEPVAEDELVAEDEPAGEVQQPDEEQEHGDEPMDQDEAVLQTELSVPGSSDKENQSVEPAGEEDAVGEPDEGAEMMIPIAA
ncbi:hypothetical protein C8J56DRAFT_898663 [Mycena floridula]|nr:hypothetical protein C8J56DRAFT_898663 [Mycena floridula]